MRRPHVDEIVLGGLNFESPIYGTEWRRERLTRSLFFGWTDDRLQVDVSISTTYEIGIGRAAFADGSLALLQGLIPIW